MSMVSTLAQCRNYFRIVVSYISALDFAVVPLVSPVVMLTRRGGRGLECGRITHAGS